MGYYTRVCGKLDLDPPIHFESEEEADYFDNLAWIVALQPVMCKASGAWACTGFKEHGEPSKLYNFEAQIKSFLLKYPGHKFKGVLHFEGESQGDIYQWFIDGDTLIKREPKIIWPDPPVGFEEFKEHYDR